MFAYTRANHNSVLGIRQMAKASGCKFASVASHPLFASLSGSTTTSETPSAVSLMAKSTRTQTLKSSDNKHEPSGVGDVPHLFALPAECNFSGAKADLSCIGMYVCMCTCPVFVYKCQPSQVQLVCICICIYVYIVMCACMCTCHVLMGMCKLSPSQLVCICMYAYVCMYVCMYVCIYIYIRIYIYICMYVCMCRYVCVRIAFMSDYNFHEHK
jgi:hypothetical protein